ncbi:DapH/DapD/GlmU-related protein [Companilactobacillus halodurans]|uniref:Sugar O-acetyltransferase n=1 Tax=Companilactobacillus halodurans TaxID=2584183 RepID=A0A5P0ZRA3_9LACO|nr:DapH/DapD/GlmU-related protein [Companilactobacillus halodurans]MQS76794.1 sugar O-acetyltransferase [Companilactobacillus halodurans]MQS96770.1 sugar O-acetyltransferase [Companilactobacillus halodurans]
MTCQSDLFNIDKRLVEQNQRLMQRLNTGHFCSQEINQLLSEIFGYELNPNNEIRLPFYTDYGRNIQIKQHVFINSNVTMVDIGGIQIDDDVIIGPNTTLITTNYSKENLIKKPIRIKQSANIGGQVTVLPGVTIGENSIIDAGSVVVTSVPKNSEVTGNPAKIINNKESRRS